MSQLVAVGFWLGWLGLKTVGCIDVPKQLEAQYRVILRNNKQLFFDGSHQ